MGDFKSTDLLNAIKNGATAVYKDRIPTATINNLAEVGTAILNYTETRNEFVSALFDKIAMTIIKNKLYENPLREFKKGMIENGQDIEEVFVDLVKAKAFDPSLAETEVWKRAIPDIKSVFHRINRKDQYKTTISNEQLSLAFTSDMQMNSLIDKIITTLTTSDNFDEFTIMKGMIQKYGVEGKFRVETIAAVTDEATAKAALSKIKEVSNNLTFMSSTYNYAGVQTHTLKDDQIVLIGTKFDALVDVEVLASAFNMDKADFIGRRVLIDDFGGLSNVVCAVVDRDWFMVYDKMIKSDMLYNPQGLYSNHWLNHWGLYSTSLFANAVIFQTVAPTVTAITVTPATATLSVGDVIQLNVEATGTNNPPSKCTYASNNANVYVNSAGLVVVNSGATGTATITATNVFNNAVTDTCVITIA